MHVDAYVHPTPKDTKFFELQRILDPELLPPARGATSHAEEDGTADEPTHDNVCMYILVAILPIYICIYIYVLLNLG